MELQQEYQQSELATQEAVDSQKDSHDMTAAQEQEMHDAFVDEAADKELAPERESAKNALKEITKEVQEFIKNKFVRLDDIFFKKEAKRVYTKKEDIGNPTSGSFLNTQRGNIKYTIEWNWGLWHNYNVVAKDGNDTCKILLHHNESGDYEMKVTFNNKPAGPGQAQKLATKYIGLL